MCSFVLHHAMRARGSDARERVQVDRLTRATKPPRQMYANLGADTWDFQRVCLLYLREK
jgi:hypothetical protein